MTNGVNDSLELDPVLQDGVCQSEGDVALYLDDVNIGGKLSFSYAILTNLISKKGFIHRGGHYDL